MRWIPVILILLFACCSPQRRLNSLLKHHPELVQTDTSFVMDTTFIPKVAFDTTWVAGKTDTITIDTGRLHIKIIKRVDTLEISGSCDTVIVIKKVPFNISSVTAMPGRSGLPWWAYLVAAALLLGGVFFGKKVL